MWFPDLSKTGVDLSTAFILLAWEELFNEHTPDTYKARLNDTYSLVGELSEVARYAEGDPRWGIHVEHLLAELQASAKSDLILEKHYPQLQEAIAAFDKNSSQSRSLTFAHVAQSELSDYEDRVFDNFVESIKSLPKEKARVLNAIRRVAVRAVQRGLLPDECRDCVDDSFLTLNPVEAGERILASLRQTEQGWNCIVGITGEESNVAALIHGTGFVQLPNRRKPLGQKGRDYLEQTKELFLAITDVIAVGPSDALQIALRPLRLVLDVANFNHRGAPFQLAPYVYLEAGRNQRIVNLHANSYGGLEPKRDPTDSAASMQRSGVLGRLPERIATVLEQHSVARASTDPKVRFVNLWVALETLVGHEQDSSIIETVIRRIAPLIVHRRINRIIKYLAISLHEFGFGDTIADPTGWFKKTNADKVQRDELLLALAGAAGKVVHDELAALTLSHPLLCNRIFLVHKEVAEPKALLQELRDSQIRTEWQLRRIYRARNLLVHAGAMVKMLPQLTANLEYYYSLTLSHILHDFVGNKAWTVEQSFERRRIMFEYLVRRLDRSPTDITVADVLQHGSATLLNNKLWLTRDGAPTAVHSC